jgi:hypothetical protein
MMSPITTTRLLRMRWISWSTRSRGIGWGSFTGEFHAG